MAVGRHAAQGVLAQVEQQAVEVVAHVLLRHGEGGALQQLLERGLGHADLLGGIHFVQRGEIVRRQGGQAEAASARLHGHFVPALADRDPAAIREGADDVEQLACRNGDLAVLRILRSGARNHLDFQVGAGQRQLTAVDADQQVRQDRQGMPAFDHIDDLRQRLQQDFALQGKPHVDPSPFWLVRKAAGWQALAS